MNKKRWVNYQYDLIYGWHKQFGPIIAEIAKHQCQVCGKRPGKSDGVIHHVNYNKPYSWVRPFVINKFHKGELKYICNECHAKIHPEVENEPEP